MLRYWAVLAVLFLVPIQAVAEMPWKTTQWQVACTHELHDRADQSWPEWEEMIEEILERELPPGESEHRDEVEEMVRSGFRRFSEQAQQLCRPGSQLAAVTTEQLERASEWLRTLGFNGPDLAVTDEDIESLLFPASLLDCVSNYCAAFEYLKGSHGVYRSGGYLRIDLFNINALFPVEKRTVDGKPLRPSDAASAYTPVHELFHAVQMGSAGLDKTTMFSCANDWLIEGTARYSNVVAARKWGALYDPTPIERYYDDSLHVPPIECDRPSSDLDRSESARLYRWKYGSWTFWDYLGERTATADGFAYLSTVLRHDLSTNNGLDGTDEALRDWHPERLYALYPEFVRDRLVDDSQFSEDGVHTLRMPWPDERRQTTMPDIVNPVATNAFDLRIEVPPGESAVLRVSVVEEDEALHLIVDDQLLSDAERGDRRNLYETLLSGRADDQKRFIRVANIAREPGLSSTKAYNLAFELEPVDSCEPETLLAAVNEENFPAGTVIDPEAQDPDGLQRPLESQMSIRGLISDGGSACTHHLGALDMTGSFLAGGTGQDEMERTMRERARRMQERLEGMDLEGLRSAAADGDPGLSPDQMAELMAMADEMGDVVSPSEPDQADAVINVYSPHAWTWQSGSLAPPRGTRHDGIGGWATNSASAIVIQLPGTPPEALEVGKRYSATAYAAASDEEDTPSTVPTLSGFYTAWEGEYGNIPYRSPQSAGEARRQQRLKQRCRQQKRQAETVMAQMEPEARIMASEMLDQGDCDFRGTAFQGTTRVLSGSLTGEVLIKEITAAEVKGRFSLSGDGSLELVEWRFTYDEETGVLDGDEKEISKQHGPVAIEGSFSAPMRQEGMMRPVGYRSVVIDRDDAAR